MRIFLSYRRDDAGGWTTALAAALQSRFGRKNVFIDVEHIQNFEDFEQRIVTSIDQCDVLLAVIGKHWSTIRDQETGRRRLENPRDYVRLEVARALQRRLPVLPVLVDGATLPSLEELPDDLSDLLRPSCQRLTQEHWQQDLRDLLHRIDVRRQSRRPVLVALLSFITGILTGVLGSAIARRYLGYVAPPCVSSKAGSDCPPTYDFQPTGSADASPGSAPPEQRRTAPSATRDHHEYGDRRTAYGAGQRYPGYGYRGGVGGKLL
jgi:hypothetical protein